jgi:hypothetical protein
VLMKALNNLERRNLAKVFSGHQSESVGVKFFPPSQTTTLK